MLRATVNRALLALALLPWCGCKHTCDDTPSDVVDFFAQIERTHAAEIGWVGLVETGELDESQAWTSATIEVVLEKDSATAEDANDSIGCDPRYTIDATLLITSEDGLLDEAIQLELVASPANGGITGFADLANHDFAGELELGPEWTGGQLQLHVAFAGDSLLFGWLFSKSGVDFEAEELVGGGSVAFIEPWD
jgi:hypothetical protein